MQIKKAQTNLIVGLILLLIVFVVIIISITGQWNTLGEKINIFGQYEQNIDVIQNRCELACIQQNTTIYCENIQKLRLDKETQIKKTCEELSHETFNGFEIKTCTNLCD